MPRPKATATRAARQKTPIHSSSIARVGSNFLKELADEESTSGIERRYGFQNEDPHPSFVLQEHSSATQRLGEFQDEMLEKDLDLDGFFGKRFDGVVSLPSRIVPGDGTPDAKEAAEMVAYSMGKIPDHAASLVHELTAIPRGVAFTEVMWERATTGPYAGAWLPVDLIDRPMHRFGFRKGELFVRRANDPKGIVPPPGKFLVLTYGTKDTRWGKPLLDKIFWTWFFKRNAVKFYAIFLDKFGQPTLVGKYKHGKDAKTNAALQEELHAAIEEIQTEYGVTIPDGLALEFLEAKRSGTATYDQFVGMCTRAEAVRVLGEVDTSGAGKGPGSFGKSVVSDGVRYEKVELDARMLAGHRRDTLYTYITQLNFGPDVAVPRLAIDTIDVEDREQRMKGIEAAFKAKQPVPKRYFALTSQVPIPEDGEEVIEPPKELPPVPPPGGEGKVPTDDDPDDEGSDPEGGEKPEPKPEKPSKTAKLSDDPKLIESITKTARLRSADLTKLARQSSGAMIEYYSTWREELHAAYDDGDLGRALRRLVGRINPVESAEALHTAQVHAAGLTQRALMEDRGDTDAKLSLPPGWDQAKTPGSAMEFWTQLLKIKKDAFSALDDSSRRFAFTVAGVSDMTLLSEIHQLIGGAIVEGWPRREFVANLDQLFERRGVDPLSRWHAELVFQNNVRQVAGLLKWQQLVGNPAAPRLTPYLMWLGTGLDNMRPEHATMHQYVAAVLDAIWATWWIPGGHGCCCDIVPINLAKAKRLGYTGSQPIGPWPLYNGARVMPDPGFAGAPNLDATSDTFRGRAEEMIDDARSAGATDLLEALLQIFLSLIERFISAFDFSEPTALGNPAR